MNNMMWLVRAALWARNPPSPRRVKFVLAIIGAGLALAAIEYAGLWPEWATVNDARPRLPN